MFKLICRRSEPPAAPQLCDDVTTAIIRRIDFAVLQSLQLQTRRFDKIGLDNVTL